MASIFEEMMTANHKLTESTIRRPKKSRKTEGRKINFKRIRVESRKFLEDTDPDIIEQEFAVAEDTPDEVVLVIDPEISDSEEIPEDAAEEMIGDDVYKCPVCGANYVCSCDGSISEDITVDEDGVPVECPVCGDDADQILVGTIAPADEAPGDEVDPPMEDNDDDDLIVDDEEEFVEDADGDEFIEDDIEEFAEESARRRRSVKSRKESRRKTTRRRRIESAVGSDVGRYQRWVDYDLKRYGKISDRTWSFLKKAKLTVDDEDNVVTEGCLYEDDDEMIVDDFDTEASEDIMVLDTPDYTVTGDAPDVVITNSEVNLMLDDTRLESMINRMMRENYKGAPRCKITKVRSSGRTLKIEYIIRRNGKSTKGRLVGEGYNPKSRIFKIAFKNQGKTFAESTSRAPIMTVEFKRQGRNIVPTRMSYDYKVKVKESLYRVSGRVLGESTAKKTKD